MEITKYLWGPWTLWPGHLQNVLGIRGTIRQLDPQWKAELRIFIGNKIYGKNIDIIEVEEWVTLKKVDSILESSRSWS